MKRLLTLVAFVVLSMAGTARAQDATPTSSLAWDIVAGSLAEAQGYTYRHYDDGAATGVAFAGVTCTGAASPYACQVAFPAFAPGNHAIAVSAANVAGESPKSAALAFTFYVIPATPTTLRIAGGL